MNNTRTKTAQGVTILGLLTIAFVVLKLTGAIGWSWWWILSPIWIPATVVLALVEVVNITVIVKMVTAEMQRIHAAGSKEDTRP